MVNSQSREHCQVNFIANLRNIFQWLAICTAFATSFQMLMDYGFWPLLINYQRRSTFFSVGLLHALLHV